MKERDETTYYNDKGYPCYKDSHALCHIKTAKKKYGEDYSKTNHIHHLDGNKDNYRHDNLVMVHPKDHELLERRIKNIKTGQVVEETFRSGEKIEVVKIEAKEASIAKDGTRLVDLNPKDKILIKP